jgi:septal ring factor EnvC (AmiA/AmiB activator)
VKFKLLPLILGCAATVTVARAVGVQQATPSSPLADLHFAEEEQDMRARALKERLGTVATQAREKAKLLHALQHGAASPRFAWEDVPKAPAQRERLKRIVRVALREQMREVTRLEEQLKEVEVERAWIRLRLAEAEQGEVPGALDPNNVLPPPPAPAKAVSGSFRCQGLPVESEQADAKISLVQDFGPRRDAETGVEWRSMGWWLAGLDSKVQACAPGIVAFSGKVPGRGRVVMIDHGNGSMTLYANLAEDPGIRLPKGTKVKAGQVVGSPLEKFYFEVRREGLAVDPRQVFAAVHLSSLAL